MGTELFLHHLQGAPKSKGCWCLWVPRCLGIFHGHPAESLGSLRGDDFPHEGILKVGTEASVSTCSGEAVPARGRAGMRRVLNVLSNPNQAGILAPSRL